MVIYVITFLVFAAILIGAFRSMGGETVDDATAEAFLTRMVGWLEAECDRVAPLGTLSADDLPSPAVAALGEEVHIARKTLSGYQQQLTRFESDDPGVRRLRALLSLAIESLGWSCRIAEAGSLEVNPGVRAAVAQLYGHARACVDEARDLAVSAPTGAVAASTPG